MTPQNIPAEVIGDIWHYLHPDRLHAVASCLKYSSARYVVNRMVRDRYIERWLDTCQSNNSNTTYMMCSSNFDHDLEYILNNYWYYMIKLHIAEFYRLLGVIDKIKNKKISLYIKPDNMEIYKMNIGIDISGLENIHSLCIQYINITKLGSLTNVHKLSLINVKILDPNMQYLDNVHTLILQNIYFNPNIMDYIKNVYILELIEYTNILDVSALANIYSLTLHNCNKITTTSLDVLRNIHTLSICNCSNIPYMDARNFSNICNLQLKYLDTIGNIKQLGNVTKLHLLACNCISDISMLGSVQALDIVSCKNIQIDSVLYIFDSSNIPLKKTKKQMHRLKYHKINFNGYGIFKYIQYSITDRLLGITYNIV